MDEKHDVLQRLQKLSSRVFTTGEIAKFCDVNVRTVIRWIDRGQLTAYRLPAGDNRISSESFLTFLRQHNMPIPGEFRAHARRVLIVEDDQSMARNVERILTRNGYETLVASNGFQAGVWLGSFSPALVTLDLNMPGLSGFDVLKLIRETEDFAFLKVLVVSALSSSELDRARSEGADDVLAKPFTNEGLIGKVSELTGVEYRHRSAGAGSGDG